MNWYNYLDRRQIGRSSAYEEEWTDHVALVSYQTRVLEWYPETGDLVVGPLWDCSATTRRHVSRWLASHGIRWTCSDLRYFSRFPEACPWDVVFADAGDDRFLYNEALPFVPVGQAS